MPKDLFKILVPLVIAAQTQNHGKHSPKRGGIFDRIKGELNSTLATLALVLTGFGVFLFALFRLLGHIEATLLTSENGQQWLIIIESGIVAVGVIAFIILKTAKRLPRAPQPAAPETVSIESLVANLASGFKEGFEKSSESHARARANQSV